MWQSRYCSCNWKNYSVFLVYYLRSYAIFAIAFLVLSPYFSDGATDCVIFRVEIISVDE